MKKYRLVEENELINILEGYNKFLALEFGGVDNWGWYGAAIGDYLEAWVKESDVDPTNDWDFRSIAELDLNRYSSTEF